MIRIVVIDERESDRNLIQAMLSFQADFEVVGCGKDGFDALKLTAGLQPDVVIMDIGLSDFEGTEIIPLLKRKAPQVALLILTDLEDESHICKVAEQDVNGYLLKSMDMDKLINAVRSIRNGERFLSAKILDKAYCILSDMLRNHEPQAKTTQDKQQKVNIPANLSRMELRLMAFVAQGCSTREIAANMCLSTGTVRNYLSVVMQKTGLKNRTQMATFALKVGLIKE
jgi:DNA-binding NarL/FixJ family response regulator